MTQRHLTMPWSIYICICLITLNSHSGKCGKGETPMVGNQGNEDTLARVTKSKILLALFGCEWQVPF